MAANSTASCHACPAGRRLSMDMELFKQNQTEGNDMDICMDITKHQYIPW